MGAYACLESSRHRSPRGSKEQKAAELVPVAYSSNDVIYYLDKYGAGWAHDTIEGAEAVRFASNGATLVAKIFLYGIAWGAQTDESDSAETTGARGEAAAKELGLPALPSASDDFCRWWGDEQNLLFETTREGEKTTKIVALGPKGKPTVAKARTLWARTT